MAMACEGKGQRKGQPQWKGGREGGTEREKRGTTPDFAACGTITVQLGVISAARMAPGVAADGLGMVQGGNTSVINVPYIRMDTTCLAS
jgi:hypothetical protein